MQVKDFFSRIHTAEITDREFIKDTSLDFCRKQKLKSALMKTIGLMKSSSYDEISKVINDALTLGMGNEAGYEYLTDFEERYQLKARNPQTTGWDEIDTITAGGWHLQGQVNLWFLLAWVQKQSNRVKP